MTALVTNVSRGQSVYTQHVRRVTRTAEAQTTGRLPAEQVMNLDLVLPLRDEAGLQSFLKDVYDPTSPNYHHFLSVAEFTERFGPSQDDYDSVVRFAKTYGFTVAGGTRDGMEVQVKGPVSSVETAFHVNMRTYQHPEENRTFFAPDREPTTELTFPLWHIGGLDDYSIPHPLVVKRSDYAKANGMYPEAVVKHATTGSGPASSFLGSDMRAAYYGGTALTGAGQNLGLFEYEGTDLDDLKTYYKNTGQTNKVPVTLFSTDGTSTACVDTAAGGNCDDTEQTLDMTQALGMAPGLASMVVYIGSSDTSIISAMTTHSPLPTTIGCSWGWSPVDPKSLDPYFQRMAAQGQNFFAASGDSSTWSASNGAWPADDDYVVSVGGTDLITAGAGGAWQSETAWSNSGGGISPDDIVIPAWQQLAGVINSSNQGSNSYRNGPDVSANANFTFYTCSDQASCMANEYGGTSFAAPMWAGYLALVNQQMVASGKSTVGFINPIIYQQNLTSNYSADFHDITSGSSGSYAAVKGFDLVTGWGSPNSGLLSALSGPAAAKTPAFTISAATATVTVGAGKSGSTTVTTAVSGGENATVTLSASGAPAGVTVSFSPATIAAPGSGSSTVNFNVASSTKSGTYSIVIAGTSNGATHNATVTLTVTAAAAASFSVSARTTSISVSRSKSGTLTVSTAILGSFNGVVSLSAAGQGTNNSITFSPASIGAPGSGQSTMTISVGKTATVGSHVITITAQGSGKVETASVTLNIPN